MSEVKRYDCSGTMCQEEGGDWVCVELLQTAQTELAALREELATAKRNEYNSEVAYKAAIEKQHEIRAERDALQLLLNERDEKLGDALASEAALREELATSNKVGTAIGETLGRVTAERDDLHKRLTAAEQRNVELWKLVEFAYDHEEIDGAWVEDYRRLKLLEAKPTESGASDADRKADDDALQRRHDQERQEYFNDEQ